MLRTGEGRRGAGWLGAGRRAERSAGPRRAGMLGGRGGEWKGGGIVFSGHLLHFNMRVKRPMVWTLIEEAEETDGGPGFWVKGSSGF